MLSPRGTKKKRERNRAIVLSHRAREKNKRKKQGYCVIPQGKGEKQQKKGLLFYPPGLHPVSYTHLTLPTITKV